MKTCKDVLELIPLYITQDLAAAEQEAVRVHLLECSDCQTYAGEIANIQSLLKVTEDMKVNPAYGAELMVGINKRLDRRKKRQQRLLWLLPSASTVILLLVLGLIFLYHPGIVRNIFPDWESLDPSELFALGAVEFFDADDLIGDESSTTVELTDSAIEYLLDETNYAEAMPLDAVADLLSTDKFEQLIRNLELTIL